MASEHNSGKRKFIANTTIYSKMKIATWSIERPTRKGKKSPAIVDYLKKLDADILVLIESNEFINLGTAYELFHTENKATRLSDHKGVFHEMFK